MRKLPPSTIHIIQKRIKTYIYKRQILPKSCSKENQIGSKSHSTRAASAINPIYTFLSLPFFCGNVKPAVCDAGMEDIRNFADEIADREGFGDMKRLQSQEKPVS